MIIIKQRKPEGKHFVVTISLGENKTEEYSVYADNEKGAIDIIADRLESQGRHWFYFGKRELQLMALCSSYNTVEEFAKVNNLTCCGTNGIYIEVVGVKEAA